MAIRQTVKSYDDVITFGKFNGKTFGVIAEVEPSYLEWLNNEEIVDMPAEMVQAAIDDAAEKEDSRDEWAGMVTCKISTKPNNACT